MRACLMILCLTCVGLSGCAHRATILSDPPGATVIVGDVPLGPAPQEVRFLWWPRRPMRVSVSAPGYRPAEIMLRGDAGPVRFLRELLTLRFKRLLGIAPRTSHEVILVREHGPAGTWGAEDVEL